MSMGEDTTEVSLPEILNEVVEATGPERRAVEVTTDLPASPELTTNRDALYAGVEGALENAFEYATSAVRVTVEDAPQGYSIVDVDGPGIPQEELVPIEAGTETNLDHGRGLGLRQLRL